MFRALINVDLWAIHDIIRTFSLLDMLAMSLLISLTNILVLQKFWTRSTRGVSRLGSSMLWPVLHDVKELSASCRVYYDSYCTTCNLCGYSALNVVEPGAWTVISSIKAKTVWRIEQECSDGEKRCSVSLPRFWSQLVPSMDPSDRAVCTHLVA